MNTLDAMIVTFDEDPAMIAAIAVLTNLDFKLITESSACGGPAIVIFEAYAYCGPSPPRTVLKGLIDAFQTAPCSWPATATLFIDDDNNDCFNGIILREDRLCLD